MPKLSRTATAAPTRRPSRASLVEKVREFRVLVKQVSSIEKRRDTIKADLKTAVDALGEPDSKGSLWVEFDSPVEDVIALKHERRVSTFLNEDKASVILQRKGLLEKCQDVDVTIDAEKMAVVVDALKAAGVYDEVVTTTTRISEDKIMQAYAADELTAREIDRMFTENVTWAFKPITADRPETRA